MPIGHTQGLQDAAQMMLSASRKRLRGCGSSIIPTGGMNETTDQLNLAAKLSKQAGPPQKGNALEGQPVIQT
jgi:hypothetical protein